MTTITTTATTANPPITISTLDIERIEQLIESPQYKHAPGIEALQEELYRANVVEPADVPPDLVTMNSSVLVRDENTHEELDLTLVYPSPSPAPGEVSILAPVGAALLGLSVGQSIEWPAPGHRKMCLRVLKVISQPEANRQYHR